MYAYLIALAIFSFTFTVGCDKVVGASSSPTTPATVIALLDSAQYHLDVSEQPNRVLDFLAQLKPMRESSPEVRQRFTGILLGLAWHLRNYEDVLIIAAPSLYELSVKGTNYSGEDAYLANMAAHALKKSGDTVSAIKLYEMLASSEFLSFRRGSQANLLTLCSKCNQHQRAVQIASALERQEMMNPNDIAAHLNREYYWGRSLYALGKRAEGIRHIQNLAPYLRASRSNLNTTEIRVRMSTVRAIQEDLVKLKLPSYVTRLLAPMLQHSLVVDSATLADVFHQIEIPTHSYRVTIPDSLFFSSTSFARCIPSASLDEVVVTSTDIDRRGVRWVSTLFGLYVTIGDHLVRISVPEHRGIARPTRSVRMSSDTVIVHTYTNSVSIPIHKLIANYNAQPKSGIAYTVRPASAKMSELFARTTFRVNDTSILVATGSRLQLETQSGSRQRIVETPHVFASGDTVISIFATGDSIIVTTRTFGMRFLRRSMLEQGIWEYSTYNAQKAIDRMQLPSAASEIVTKHNTGEHPRSLAVVHDGLGPSTLQRLYFIDPDIGLFIRSKNIAVWSVTSKKLRMLEWPDSLARSIELGFHTALVGDSIVTISTAHYQIFLNTRKLLAQPPPEYITAVFSNDDRINTWIGWTAGADKPTIPCGDSISFIAGTSTVITDYLTSVTAHPSWSSATVAGASIGLHHLDVPNVQSCSLRFSAPGVVNESSVILQPRLHPLMYQDVWILFTIIISGSGAWFITRTWRSIALRNRESLELQHSSIARDLHDTLGADLARLTALLNASDTRQSRDIANAALAANRKFRSLLWIWRSDSIELSDFAGEIREYVIACLSDAHIYCAGELPRDCEDVFVSATIAKNILIILNESITNVIRHSQATHVDLHFTYADNSCTISLADNGIGFDLHSVQRTSGISNIPVRAIQNGFIAQVLSAPYSGTTILISFGVH